MKTLATFEIVTQVVVKDAPAKKFEVSIALGDEVAGVLLAHWAGSLELDRRFREHRLAEMAIDLRIREAKLARGGVETRVAEAEAVEAEARAAKARTAAEIEAVELAEASLRLQEKQVASPTWGKRAAA